MSVFAELSPPYSTLVVDPPWTYKEGSPSFVNGKHGGDQDARRSLPYEQMSTAAIAALPVGELVGANAHLYLWTTNRYVRAAYEVAEAWGFRPAQLLVWCKEPMGLGPGGAFVTTTEFVLFARRGFLTTNQRVDTSWWQWKRTSHHSAKPDAFMDVVERVSPGPYVELFSRRPRFGWDSWGHGYESGAA